MFVNDYAALKPDVPEASLDVEGFGLLRAQTERGICRVLCFDPRHDLTLATMPVEGIRRVVDLWAAQSAELGAQPEIGYVQIFENRGAMMGASNPHPHSQIWATESLPNEPAREAAALAAHRAAPHFQRIVIEQLVPLLAARTIDEFDVADRAA